MAWCNEDAAILTAFLGKIKRLGETRAICDRLTTDHGDEGLNDDCIHDIDKESAHN